ncbi:phage regulatory protein, Rha family [[Clostridium] leptum DSM 753]|jgi:Rha family phage regulatory protein|uniref:Phage regulatory protein, Rha family n=1 Tax=[Clostridium] leptum DSM 753 TaxID=428125 RepID=A7VT87_9FIRM|nr:phage regulatory protein, Rha family [[Clostridium] leptum DSM 753]MCC3319251.1 Rha family transcriptional regulator [[Clostridium] innocuum]PEQ24615.1 Rha family transcriptional regulator [[Clostridium] leptum DSM 753]
MLVKIVEQNKEEILTANSRDVAEHFEKQHKDVLESIRNLTAENSATKSMFIETSFESRGKFYPQYELTRDGFSLLVMGFTGSKALEWKLKYIEAFNEMERELKRLFEERKRTEIERAKGIIIRHVLTDTIKMKIADSPNKKFAYPNYTKLIYRTIFGKSLKELQADFGVKPKETVRDYMTAEQLKEVESMEMLVSSLINLGMSYDEIKSFIQQKYTPMLMAG